MPGDSGEVTLPATVPVKSGAVLLALFSGALHGLVQPYTSKRIITLPWVSYAIPKNNLLAYIYEDMLCCFLKFSKQNSYTGNETRNEICIRILGANSNIKMRGNCKVLISCFLYLEASQVKVVALCAGSGSSVLQGAEADLYLTGRTAFGSFFYPFAYLFPMLVSFLFFFKILIIYF